MSTGFEAFPEDVMKKPCATRFPLITTPGDPEPSMVSAAVMLMGSKLDARVIVLEAGTVKTMEFAVFGKLLTE